MVISADAYDLLGHGPTENLSIASNELNTTSSGGISNDYRINPQH